MLVLSRKQNESIFINGDVVVTVLCIRGNRVRIGIEAPVGVPVHRKEICQRIWEEDVAVDVVQQTGRNPQ